MPSDRRLHPTAVLFGLVQQVRWLVIPAILALVATRASRWQQWEIWMPVLLVPYAIASVLRYLTFRYRCDAGELVIRKGLIFRSERHVPYERIQNLDAVQNVFHRLFGVVEVRVETGGGEEPEATLRVLPLAAYEEMRLRVMEGKRQASATAAPGRGAPVEEGIAEAPSGGAAPRPDSGEEPATAAVSRGPSAGTGMPERTAGAGGHAGPAGPAREAGYAGTRWNGAAGKEGLAAAAGRTLLRLTARDLLLCGLIRNRGAILIAAGFGLLWEMGLMDGLLERTFDQPDWGGGLVRDLAGAFLGSRPFPAGRAALALGGLAGLLVVVRLVSMVYEPVRLHGFRLARTGADLRAEFGLLTRVAATIPLRRVQSLTVGEGPLHRLFGRASVKVETAGGGGGEGSDAAHRDWLAPIIRSEDLPALIEEVLPGVGLPAAAWRPVAPRAFRRALRARLIVAAAIAAPLAFFLRWWGLAAFAALAAWAPVGARQLVRHLGWAITGDAVLFRSGWLRRHLTIVRFSKIQAVAMRESPFDRRARMARLIVDTAGAAGASHRVEIPYLPRRTAVELRGLLSARAAGTAFQW